MEIAQISGPRVAGIVRGRNDSLAQDHKVKGPWCEQKEEYIKHLQEVPLDVILVFCADKLPNACAIWTDIHHDGVETMDPFNTPGPGISWYCTWHDPLCRVQVI